MGGGGPRCLKGGQGGLMSQGGPDCRAQPVGDGLIGVDGQNCPFQMYSVFGSFNVSRGGAYSFCLTSSDGYILCLNCC